MKKNCSKKRLNKASFLFSKLGFTLIELLVVMSIIGLLFGIGLARYRDFSRRQVLVQAVEELKINLHFARDKALAGEKPPSCVDKELDGYKLKFVAAGLRYQIHPICDTVEQPEIKRVPLPDSVTGPSGVGARVTFKSLGKGTGEGEVTFTLTYLGMSDSVKIKQTGVIE